MNEMLLLIDAGNTRVKWAVLDPAQPVALGAWLKHGWVSHQDFAQLRALWATYPLQRALISNVAGAAMQTQLAAALPRQVQPEWFVSQSSRAGLNNHYRNPQQLGSDRFASAIGALALSPGQNLIVATCGTATTIDAVTAQGNFIGGMIAPGLQLMAQSLAQNTAQLPQVQDAASVVTHFADSTEAAIWSGCLAAQVGAIEHAVHNFSLFTQSEAGGLPLCLLSGGAAPWLSPSLRVPHRVVDNLVLIGLQASSLNGVI